MRKSLILFLAGGVLAGCDCNKPKNRECEGQANVQPDHLGLCTTQTDCGEHYDCKAPVRGAKLMCCVFKDRECTTEADCCPGQSCPNEVKKCFDKYTPCDAGSECGELGDQFCDTYTDHYGTSKRCRYHACGANGECPDGQSCFQGECMASLPCTGKCPPGEGCVPSANRCQDYSMPKGRSQAACPMSCAPGFIATFNDNRDIWDSCQLPKVKCVCAELPGLASNDLGRFSALASDPGKALWVSSYDGQYGDLVVYKYDLQGKRASGFPMYVDGVPANGTMKYGPSGPRGGIVEPGDDVGRYSDIAVGKNSVVYVSYQDATKADLLFAFRPPNQEKFTISRIDGETSDTGYYTSLAIDADGLPGIAYFQKGGADNFDLSSCPGTPPTGPKAFITALKFAKATTATPAGPSDWRIKTLACQARPATPCFQCNGICADPGSGPTCLMAASGGACVADGGGSACDANKDACVSVNGAPKCAKKYTPSEVQELSEGVGLFSSLTFKGRDAFIAYMKRGKPAAGKPAKGDLYGIQVTATGSAMTAIALDSQGDTGYFPDVKIDPNSQNVTVSYHDFSSRALKYYNASSFGPKAVPEIIDPGTGASGSGESNWVGTDSATLFGPKSGQVYAVYQDATNGDLKLSKRVGDHWEVQKSISTQGSVGFFADGVFEDGRLFASHARLKARLVNGEPHLFNTLLFERVDAP